MKLARLTMSETAKELERTREYKAKDGRAKRVGISVAIVITCGLIVYNAIQGAGGSVFSHLTLGAVAGFFALYVLKKEESGSYNLRIADDGLHVGSELVIPWDPVGRFEVYDFGRIKGDWLAVRFVDWDACHQVFPSGVPDGAPVKEILFGHEVLVGFSPLSDKSVAKVLEQERMTRTAS